jgi:cytoskeletal protein CcmA (bactofilin family)
MFSRADKSRLLWTANVEKLRRSPETAEQLTIIGAQLTINGDVECHGDVQIFGLVEGNVRGETVIVEYGGLVEGGVFAQKLVIAGAVNGPVTATDIRVEGTAKIIGNITHNMLTIEPGAILEGRRPWRPRPVKG